MDMGSHGNHFIGGYGGVRLLYLLVPSTLWSYLNENQNTMTDHEKILALSESVKTNLTAYGDDFEPKYALAAFEDQVAITEFYWVQLQEIRRELNRLRGSL